MTHIHNLSWKPSDGIDLSFYKEKPAYGLDVHTTTLGSPELAYKYFILLRGHLGYNPDIEVTINHNQVSVITRRKENYI